ncbi:leucyl aminopeptidase family protein [Maritalea mediterranea]|uniref:Leucyl aminopeptidase family protein n=1 Tax=Maritalea mediterranea TaxID=2909667 RepID=A0ABS9E5D3_9HYPH|nr:leucyl aminopeptidase family protein [Maritalea mediterranea]MCF4097479.1 leucyl aminopeptidase family protein [Maritalea mediterranea]
MSDSHPISVYCLWQNETLPNMLNAQQKAWAKAHKFEGKKGELVALPDEQGERVAYLFGMGEKKGADPFVTGLAATALPEGQYELHGNFENATLAAVGFRLGAYDFDQFRKSPKKVELSGLAGADADEADLLVEAATLARDLTNRPANDLTPETYEKEIRDFAKSHGAKVSSIVGDDLLKQNFPMIHAVGRAAAEAPRLLDFTWGDESDPKITLVGKGVVFDTGGLDIKPAPAMLLMRKDMGGSANILGLAHAVMKANLKVRLRVLIPVVENSISGNAFRPGDVLNSRNGMTVEIGNTDAEGRLVLADALSLADEENPEMIIDMATLTGAARVAVGPDIGALYSTDDGLAQELVAKGKANSDALWQLPLWDEYDALLKSNIADVNHISNGPFAGSITAALFLRRFVKNAKSWTHMDIMAWSPVARPGRPMGATEQGQRAAYFMLKERFGKK